MFEEYAGHEVAAYAGYVTDRDELLQCTSGGIATALSKRVLEQGGCVAGVAYSSDFRKVRYEIISDVKDLDRFRGTKYAEAEKGTVFGDVQELLEHGRTVLFFGLPCTVGALKFFLKKEYENLYTAELICHGPTYKKVHEQYVEHLEEKYGSKLVDFSVRKKIRSWTPMYLYAKFANGKTFRDEFYLTEYGYAFTVLCRSSCYDCKFRGNNRVGDIILGDFWGATKKDPFWNKDGISAILVHTVHGDDLLKSTPGIRLFETPFERIFRENPNVWKTRKPSPERETFERLFEQHGLFYAARHAMPRKTKTKNFITRLIPRALKPLAKKIYRSTT